MEYVFLEVRPDDDLGGKGAEVVGPSVFIVGDASSPRHVDEGELRRTNPSLIGDVSERFSNSQLVVLLNDFADNRTTGAAR